MAMLRVAYIDATRRSGSGQSVHPGAACSKSLSVWTPPTELGRQQWHGPPQPTSGAIAGHTLSVAVRPPARAPPDRRREPLRNSPATGLASRRSQHSRHLARQRPPLGLPAPSLCVGFRTDHRRRTQVRVATCCRLSGGRPEAAQTGANDAIDPKRSARAIPLTGRMAWPVW